MKKLNLYIIIAISILVVSCETEIIGPIASTGARAVLTYDSSVDFPVVIDTNDAIFDIPVGISSASSQDRVFDVIINNDLTTATTDNYTIASTITIPANEYIGMLSLTGSDVTLETTPDTIVLQIQGDSNVNSPTQMTINLFQICPIPADYFLGDYSLLNLDQDTGSAFGRENFTTGSVMVTAPSQTTRSFGVNILSGGADVDLIITLVCGEINISGEYDAGFAADGAGNSIVYRPAVTPGRYDLSDDSTFIVPYTENPNDAYAPTSGPASFLLQKI